MSEELAVYEEAKPLTAAEIRGQVNLIQQVMKEVMQDGQHYGKIPGAGDKPTLLKPGAEKIMATFRLAADPEAEDLSKEGMIRYRVKCKLLWPTGRYAGAGLGEASTDEEKYKWRAIVSEAEWEATDASLKRIKYGKKWNQASHKYEPIETKQVRTNPPDLANTVLKMAKKRSLVDAVLTVTAASDIFTQDIEEIPTEMLDQKQSSNKEIPKKEEPKATKKTTSPILDIKAKKVTDPGKEPYVRYQIFGLLDGNETSFYTRDEEIAKEAKVEKGSSFPFIIEFTESKLGNEIISFSKMEPGKESDIPF